MDALPFVDYARLPAHAADELLRVVEHHRSLDQIFTWGKTQSPPVVPEDVVKQDEFTHDVLVPFPKGLWVVYGST